MKQYDKYKPSEVEWIGDIPDNWEFKKLKYVANIYRGAILRPVNNPYFFDNNGTWTYLNIGDINKKEKYIKKGRLRLSELGSNNSARVQPNNLILTASATIGEAYINKIPICIHDGFIAFTEIEINKTLLYYYLNNPLLYVSMGKVGTQKNLYLEEVKSIFMPIPPSEEQQKIVDFLDKKINGIYEIIYDKENLIKHLEEKKEVTISNAVTKGLNSDVKMQDSEVKWIGKIPDNWDSIAIKHVVSIPVTDGPHETPEFLNTGVPFISAEAIKNNIIDFSKMRGYISQEDHLKYSKKYKPQRDDIYMIKSGATTGNLAMVETDKEFNIWSPLAVIRVNKSQLLPKFTFFFLLSYNFFEAVKFNWSYGTQQNIGMNVIENISICVPLDLKEQQKIVDFLDAKTDEINQTIQIVKDEIKLLKEYKETLIYEVVTGKIDVREEVVS